MPKKKKISKDAIIEMYMSYILDNNSTPKNVYEFTSSNNFKENEFYSFFGSFEGLEQEIFMQFSENTIKVLLENKDFPNFDNRNKLLSYYFTFFENLTMNRSFVLFIINKHSNQLSSLKITKKLKKSFIAFFDMLNLNTIDLKEKKLQQLQAKAIKESAWNQLLLTIKFWIDDDSKSFEKTDIFIEKSINTSFDLMDTKPVESLMDLGKFLFKEKFQAN